MTALRIIPAQPDDLGRYLDLLEEVAEWLASRGITQWRPGSFRLSVDYYAESITHGEVQLVLPSHFLTRRSNRDLRRG
jgi:hypothetical protein